MFWYVIFPDVRWNLFNNKPLSNVIILLVYRKSKSCGVKTSMMEPFFPIWILLKSWIRNIKQAYNAVFTYKNVK